MSRDTRNSEPNRHQKCSILNAHRAHLTKNADHIQMLFITTASHNVPPSSMLSEKLNHGTTCDTHLTLVPHVVQFESMYTEALPKTKLN